MDNRMQQLSLLDELGWGLQKAPDLSDLYLLVKSDMRRILGPEEGGNRKSFVDALNTAAKRCGVRITSGNAKEYTLDMLNKMLAPSDTTHPPSLHFILVFCVAAQDHAPLLRIVQLMGLQFMSDEDKKFRDFGKAVRMERLAKKTSKRLEEQL